MTEQELEVRGEPQLVGVVEEIVFHNPTNDYTVMEVLDAKKKRLVTAVGMIPYAAEGETVELWGEWTSHPDYGKQLSITSYEKHLPDNTEDILRYLSSGTIRGVGPTTALKIVNRYGVDTFSVIENHPEWLKDIPGITAKKAAAICKAFREQGELRKLMTLCAGKLPTATIHRVFRLWGSSATGFLRRDPYRLSREVYGIGFDRADEIAALMGFTKEDPARIRAGLAYVLSNQAGQNGHACLPKEQLVTLAQEMLGVEESLVSSVLENELALGHFVLHQWEELPLVFSRTNEDAEKTVAERLLALERGAVSFDHANLVRLIERMETEWGITYAPKQKEAIANAFDNGVMILTGGPGTGKTTIIRALLRIFEILGMETALAAPTGRAAKRMSEVTIHEAKTIHRMLEMERSEDDYPKFHRDEENPLDEMVVIVDESSMIDLHLMAALLKAMRRGSRLILVGDADQLPSVGCGNILADLIASGCFKTLCLTEIFRQAEKSHIVTNAHRINAGEMPDLRQTKGDFFFLPREQEDQVVYTLEQLISQRLPKAYGQEFVGKIQVITPTRRGKTGTEQLNIALQAALNPKAKGKQEVIAHGVTFREGDRVMQVRNHYDLEWVKGTVEGTGVFNGDMGIILEIDKKEECMTISFDGRMVTYEFSMLDELEHAYAITVHKSQGSEYPVILMPITSAGYMLLTRPLLYTALTRAKDMVILVGREDVISHMVQNTWKAQRYTGLKSRLLWLRGLA